MNKLWEKIKVMKTLKIIVGVLIILAIYSVTALQFQDEDLTSRQRYQYPTTFMADSSRVSVAKPSVVHIAPWIINGPESQQSAIVDSSGRLLFPPDCTFALSNNDEMFMQPNNVIERPKFHPLAEADGQDVNEDALMDDVEIPSSTTAKPDDISSKIKRVVDLIRNLKNTINKNKKSHRTKPNLPHDSSNNEDKGTEDRVSNSFKINSGNLGENTYSPRNWHGNVNLQTSRAPFIVRDRALKAEDGNGHRSGAFEDPNQRYQDNYYDPGRYWYS